MVELLDEGIWLHLFPEGRVSPDGRIQPTRLGTLSLSLSVM